MEISFHDMFTIRNCNHLLACQPIPPAAYSELLLLGRPVLNFSYSLSSLRCLPLLRLPPLSLFTARPRAHTHTHLQLYWILNGINCLLFVIRILAIAKVHLRAQSADVDSEARACTYVAALDWDAIPQQSPESLWPGNSLNLNRSSITAPCNCKNLHHALILLSSQQKFLSACVIL